MSLAPPETSLIHQGREDIGGGKERKVMTGVFNGTGGAGFQRVCDGNEQMFLVGIPAISQRVSLGRRGSVQSSHEDLGKLQNPRRRGVGRGVALGPRLRAYREHQARGG